MSYRRRILVTGGAGFIGSAVCRHLIAEATVVNLDKLTYAGNLDLARRGRGPDATRSSAPTSATRGHAGAVRGASSPTRSMHLAAESHVDRSIDGPAAFIDTNVVGTFTPARGGAEPIGRRLASGARTASASTTSRPTRSSARSATTGSSPRTRPMRPTRPIRRRRPRPTIWCAPGTRPMACRRCSPTAPTTTGRTSSPRS